MGKTATKGGTGAKAPARPRRKASAPAKAPARRSAGRRRATTNGKKLVIVESPAKARTINRYLGRDYVVRASMGHVRDLPRRDLGVDIEKDFAPTYEVLHGRKKVLTELKKYARGAPEVYLATDLDREGEAIAWHLAEALEIPPERLRRVTFNEITKPAIRAAFANPGQVDPHKVDAQQARRILDRIVGYQVSPLLWRKVARGLSAGRVQTVAARLIVERERAIQAFTPKEFWKISAVFTPELSAAAELEEAWGRFLAEGGPDGQTPSQGKRLAFLAEHGAFRAELVEWNGQRFHCPSVESARKIAEALGLVVESVEEQPARNGEGKGKKLVALLGRLKRPCDVHYVVQSVQARTSQKRPPGPFTTATMQQAAAVQLRFAASRTMRLAQQLYEGVEVPGEGSVGLITYMRTDSLNLAPQAIEQVRAFIEDSLGQRYVPAKPNVYRSGRRAQAAHEAIRPTDVRRSPESLAGALQPDQLRLYELIWRRFVACQMPPARWNVTEIATAADVPADGATAKAVFKAVGRQLLFDGYLKVAGMPSRQEQSLPPVAENAPVAPAAIRPTQHFTQPPPRYTEASLVKALEAEDIGRPSTYAAIIQTIQDRGYVNQLERRFHATDLGMMVNDKLVKYFPDIFDLRFTARMEDQLDDIEAARTDWVKVLRDFYGPFKTDLEKATENMVHAKAQTEPSEYTCPDCGKPMVYRWSRNGRYLACTGYPECKKTFPVDAEGKRIERKQVQTPCPQCGRPMVLRRSRYGPFLGCSDYPNCKATLPCDEEGNPLRLVKEEDIKESCPECGAPMVVKRKGRRAFLGCSRYPDCKATAPLPEGVRLERRPREKPAEIGVNCPQCGKPMVIRTGRRGKFIACSGYPRCKNTYDISKLEELLAARKAGK